MSKLSNYIKQGSGRGLKIIFWFSLLLAIVFGGISFFASRTLIQNPLTQEFIASVPTFDIKDGEVQSDNIKWAGVIPAGDQIIPIVVDTSVQDVTLPTPDGFYLTKNAFFTITNQANQIEKYNLTTDMAISPAFAEKVLYTIAIISSILLGLTIIFSTWMGYLLVVAFTSLGAWLLRISKANKRVWRLSAISYTTALIVSIVAVFVQLFFATWLVLLAVILVNQIVLSRLQD